jgi:hypothetical protein
VAAGAGVALALVAGSLSAPAQAAPAPAARAVECPAAVPQSSIEAGMVGEGWTVVTGTEPQPFKVEVLGVLQNGIGAGRDLIMIKVSDLPGQEVVGERGIWAGMSGSPVYVNGQLLGAVAWGFTASPSALGGLTPAEDMFDVLNLGAGQAVAKSKLTQAAAEVKVSAARRKSLAAKADTEVPHGSLRSLTTPLGVAGLQSARLGPLQKRLDRADHNMHVYAAGSAGLVKPAAAPAARPVPGGNFAAVLASGDVAAFGTGTTTAVCGDRAVAFGHWLALAGPASYAAAGASSVAIVEDKTFGSFKLANLGPSFGTVDQDRTTAIRADLTKTPSATEISTLVRSVDTGDSRTGSTQVYDQNWLPGLTESAALAGQDRVFDEIGDGAARSTWTITGTRAGGKAFTVTRANLWASKDDVAYDPAYDVAAATDQLVNNDHEKVDVHSITFGSTLTTTYNQLRITKLAVSVNNGAFTTPRRLVVKVGDTLKLRISTAPYRSTKATTSTVTMKVPAKARGKAGALLAIGGIDLAEFGQFAEEECEFFGEGCEDSEAGSFNAVMKSLTTAPKNNALQTQLVLEDEEEEDVTVAATKTVHKGLTVTGHREIAVLVRR